MSAEEEPPEEADSEEEEYSLEDLGAAYARAMVESGLLPESPEQPESEGGEAGQEDEADVEQSTATREPAVGIASELGTGGNVTPQAIVEAALFVGHPDNELLTAAQIARTMRGVSAAEVEELVDLLNVEYEQAGHAYRIWRREGGGLLLGLADAMRPIRDAFYGKIRETRLTQAAIDVLALVAYQPGVTSVQITDQRSKDSAAVINQMVRRELLEVRREDRGAGKPVACYYPTTRLLNLLGVSSLDDLPLVDEADIAPQV